MAEITSGRIIIGCQYGSDGKRRVGYLDGLRARLVDGSIVGLPQQFMGQNNWTAGEIIGLDLGGIARGQEFYKAKSGKFVKFAEEPHSGTIENTRWCGLTAIRWAGEIEPIVFSCHRRGRDPVARWYDDEGNYLGESPYILEGDCKPLWRTLSRSLPATVNGILFRRVSSIWAFLGPGEEIACWMRVADLRELLASEWNERLTSEWRAQELSIDVKVDVQAGDVVLELFEVDTRPPSPPALLGAEPVCIGYTVVSGFTKKILYTISLFWLEAIFADKGIGPQEKAQYFTKDLDLFHFDSNWWMTGFSYECGVWALGGDWQDGEPRAKYFSRIYRLARPQFAFGGRVMLAEPPGDRTKSVLYHVPHVLPGSLEQLEVEAVEFAREALHSELDGGEPGGGPSDGSEPDAGVPLPLLVLGSFIAEDVRVALYWAQRSASF